MPQGELSKKTADEIFESLQGLPQTVLTKIVVDEILRSAEHCLDEYNSPEDEILYGTAGYLYALNLIAAKLKPHTKSCDVLVLELHKMIEKIVHKLAD